MWQATAVRHLLEGSAPRIATELGIIRPEGDLDKHSSLLKIGGRGVFASALQGALLNRSIDLAVHSTKDVPTIEPAGLAIAAFPQREDARDAVVSRHGVGLADLPPLPVIGTSSRRRAAQVLALRPDATIADLRGNIDTRLRKAETNAYDAIVLAAAGLTRMGWQDRIAEYLPFDRFVPSPGQGALAIETRQRPDPVFDLVAALDDPGIARAVTLERSFLRAMGGGCTTPVGAHAIVDSGEVRFWAMMANDDGTRLLHVEDRFPVASAPEDVVSLADRMRTDLSTRWSGAEAPAHPLAGRVALVTGTASLVERLAAAFVAEGTTVFESPTLVVQSTSDPDGLEAALQRLEEGEYEWLVVTSQQTVPVLARHGSHRIASATRIIAVGMGTAQGLEAAGFQVDAMPEAQTSAGIVTALEPLALSGASVLCLLGDRAGTTVTAALDARGARVDRVESYRTRSVVAIPEDVRAAVRQGRIDLATIPSPASARTLVEMLGVDLAALSGACMVAIGPTTAAAMAELGLPVHVVAPEPTPEGIVAATRDYFRTRT
jgi:hydroxymethylbilane synthase